MSSCNTQQCRLRRCMSEFTFPLSCQACHKVAISTDNMSDTFRKQRWYLRISPESSFNQVFINAHISAHITAPKTVAAWAPEGYLLRVLEGLVASYLEDLVFIRGAATHIPVERSSSTKRRASGEMHTEWWGRDTCTARSAESTLAVNG